MVIATEPPPGPVVARESERQALAEIEALLDAESGGLKLADARGGQTELPESVRRLLHQIVRGLAQDRPVLVVSLQRELTVAAAADLLDLPVASLIQELAQGNIPFTETGTQRRIWFEDVVAYKGWRDAERRAALDELVRLSQEMGLYELEAAGKLAWPDERGE